MRSTLGKSSLLASTLYIHHKLTPRTYLYCDSPPKRKSKKMIEPFQTTFAVPMHCGSCVDDVEGAVKKLDGVAIWKLDLFEMAG